MLWAGTDMAALIPGICTRTMATTPKVITDLALTEEALTNMVFIMVTAEMVIL